ncbi:MAG: hypothetical protein JWO04_2302 [Gammaproteobacteria bacterium]|nr:hypothetical protein [Gammaproteobacteria bacterium]
MDATEVASIIPACSIARSAFRSFPCSMLSRTSRFGAPDPRSNITEPRTATPLASRSVLLEQESSLCPLTNRAWMLELESRCAGVPKEHT